MLDHSHVRGCSVARRVHDIALTVGNLKSLFALVAVSRLLLAINESERFHCQTRTKSYRRARAICFPTWRGMSIMSSHNLLSFTRFHDHVHCQSTRLQLQLVYNSNFKVNITRTSINHPFCTCIDFLLLRLAPQNREHPAGREHCKDYRRKLVCHLSQLAN
jgi:hypothetical protein